jgi:hypothetical protein
MKPNFISTPSRSRPRLPKKQPDWRPPEWPARRSPVIWPVAERWRGRDRDIVAHIGRQLDPVAHAVPMCAVEQNRDLAGGRCHGPRLAGTRGSRRQNAPSAGSLHPTVVAATLEDLRVREDSILILPPESLLPCARQSQEVKGLALGHAFRSMPRSPISFNASDGPSPWISVRSTRARCTARS